MCAGRKPPSSRNAHMDEACGFSEMICQDEATDCCSDGERHTLKIVAFPSQSLHTDIRPSRLAGNVAADPFPSGKDEQNMHVSFRFQYPAFSIPKPYL